MKIIAAKVIVTCPWRNFVTLKIETEKRKFIVADCLGHEQYTRNTGASTADLAVILIDARKGVLVQTRRHSYLAQLLGIRHIVLAVSKMDLVDYDQQVFDRIVADYGAFCADHRHPGLYRHPHFRLQGGQYHPSGKWRPVGQHTVVFRPQPDWPSRNR
jgi:Elongation factor Tu GTP binding domain